MKRLVARCVAVDRVHEPSATFGPVPPLRLISADCASDFNAAGVCCGRIVWVDYDAAISLHAAITGKVSDRRLHRLTTATPADNRISYGCINLPAEFFETIVRPLFGATISIVYILPETRSIRDEFFATPEGAPDAGSIQIAVP